MKQQITKIIYYFSFAMIVLAALPTLAQNKGLLVRGQVVDAGDNLSIPGATIVEQDAENRTVTGVITDIDGNFAIRVKNPQNKSQQAKCFLEVKMDLIPFFPIISKSMNPNPAWCLHS
jgi:hypothetical protein